MGVFYNFKLTSTENRGIYHGETERIHVYPQQHENVPDILSTINHETFHLAIDHADETIDEEQEERLIFCLQWADEYCQ